MINAYAAFEPGGELKPFQYDPGPLDADDVEIAVEHCGICHSDLSMRNDEWGMSTYPLVPGHEAIGTIAAVGDRVTHLKPGQRVGLGWHAGYCMVCPSCMSGDHNLCVEPSQTIVGRHGAFADRVRADAASVLPLPDGLDVNAESIESREPKALEAAAGRFALVASTVNVKLDWNAYVATLRPKGRLHFLGVTTEPLDLSIVPFLFHQYSISGSPVGSPATIRRMLDFAARHGLNPVTEHFRFDQVNEAMAHLASGQARYRIVLSH